MEFIPTIYVNVGTVWVFTIIIHSCLKDISSDRLSLTFVRLSFSVEPSSLAA